MAKKKNKGGRKKLHPSQKAVLVGFYTQRSTVDSLGGMEKAREIAKNVVEHEAHVLDTGRDAMHG